VSICRHYFFLQISYSVLIYTPLFVTKIKTGNANFHTTSCFSFFFFSGYMSPEYAVDGFFSVKSDVFSFGVLVLEIVSGKKNRGFNHPDHHHNLLGHVSYNK